MAATQTVPQHLQHCNFSPVTPRHGVVTLFGYGIKANVDRGHLVLEDGIGPERRQTRFPRVGHGIRRLVVIGSNGFVSLSALRWLADQNASFTMLERDGKVLAATGPVASSDVRLRRAQAVAHQSGAALEIARELIDHKLQAQLIVIEKYFYDSSAATAIADARRKLSTARSKDEIRLSESQGALAYWNSFRKLPVNFVRVDLPRVPEHWRTFGSRMSPLTASPRLAVNPSGAILNYLYAVLEAEARLAAAAVGLDPGLGFLHNDLRSRDSLACDLMEPVRPLVDQYMLDLLKRSVLRRDWFFENRDGNCRLMARFVEQLSRTSSMWRTAVAPYAERIARTLWTERSSAGSRRLPATPLTQDHRRRAKNQAPRELAQPNPRLPSVCQTCGARVKRDSRYCVACAVPISRRNLAEAAKLGRIATVSPEAQAKRSATHRRQAAARKAWNPSANPAWLNEEAYRERIMPKLRSITVPAILSTLHVSEPYATNIRSGRCIPHPRHWVPLARLTDTA